MNARRRPSRWLPVVVGGGAVGLALGFVFIWAHTMLAHKSTPMREIPQVVQLIRPPPPPEAPPPPPPPEEKVEEQVPQDQPDPTPAPDSAPEQLGLDADASAGGDAFGLAARRGGADLLGTGTAIFGHFTSLLKDAIQERLSADERIRHGSYSVAVRVWMNSDGSVQRVFVVQSTGRHELDAAIEQAAHMVHLAEAPPLEMPQPIVLKIVSRG